MTSVHWLAAFVVVATAAVGGSACSSKSNGYSPPDNGNDSGSAVDATTDAPVPGEAGETGGFGDTGLGGLRDDFPNPIVDNGAPANAQQLFSATDQGTDGPCVFEPEMGSLFPSDWMRLRFRFSTTHQENLFSIQLTIPNEKDPLIVYTTGSGYTLDKQSWTTISTIGTGGPIHFTIRSLTYANGQLTGGPWKGTEGDIQVAPVPAAGSIVYWTTSGGTILKGFALGTETVKQVLIPGEAQTQCIGCHTSTPDGLFVGLTGSLNANDAGAAASVDMRSEDGTGARPAYVTQNAYLLLGRIGQHAPSFSKAHWQTGDYVVLTMMDLSAKSEIVWTDLLSQNSVMGQGWGTITRNSDVHQAASAAFSHDGQTIAYTSATSVSSGTTTTDGQIYTVPYASKQGGTASPVAGANDPGYIQYYPAFSADDQYIAFNRVPAGGSSYNNPAAELYVVPKGGGTATRLNANDPPACTGIKSPGIGNSWPKWSPAAKAKNGTTYYWLVFSSTRDPGATTPLPQIYAAPISVDAKGNVTTYSALYFWNQPETEHNHTPAWDVFQLGAQ